MKKNIVKYQFHPSILIIKNKIKNTLREEILAGRNFGGSVDPPNPEQFGGIYFGGSSEKFNLAGINFGGFAE